MPTKNKKRFKFYWRTTAFDAAIHFKIRNRTNTTLTIKGVADVNTRYVLTETKYFRSRIAAEIYWQIKEYRLRSYEKLIQE